MATNIAAETLSIVSGTDMDSYYSASRSMEPTLGSDERWFALMTGFEDKPPPRGSVIVFGRDDKFETEWVKRLVGLPGEKIQLRQGRLFIDGTPVSREKIRETENGQIVYRETLPGGRSHLILERSDDETQDNTEEFAIPDDHVFVLGDNRDYSSDSRFAQMGTVPIENIGGIAEFIYWSEDWNRMGMRIE